MPKNTVVAVHENAKAVEKYHMFVQHISIYRHPQKIGDFRTTGNSTKFGAMNAMFLFLETAKG